MNIYWLNNELVFPPLQFTSKEGIIAVGGDLSSERLLLAYSSGIFPWYSDNEPILWWSPDPRFVLFPNELVISKSMKKVIKKKIFEITFDTAFYQVIKMCREVRLEKEGTWITQEMMDAYCRLHEEGFCHSVETWYEKQLVGGLYGISLGKCFFGESMFSIMNNASKTALIILTQNLIKKEFHVIDSQVYTRHLESLGAKNIPRNDYLRILHQGVSHQTLKGKWTDLFY